MKIIISIILINIIFGCRISFSQEDSTMESFDSHHLVTVSSGISMHTVRDEIMSPLMYRGAQIPLMLTYRFRGIENRHTLLFYYDNTELNSSITKVVNNESVSHYINNLNLDFEYSFAKKVTVLKDINTSCFLGVKLSSMLNMRSQYYHYGQNLLSAEQMTGLGIHLMTETALLQEADNYLRAEVNIPCVSYVLFSERYNANVCEKFDDIDLEKNIVWQLFKKGDIVTFNKLFEVQADVTYLFVVSNHIGVNLQYRLHYYSFEQYQDLFRARVLNHQFLLGMTVKL